MSMEVKISSYRKDLAKLKGNHVAEGFLMSFEDALDFIRENANKRIADLGLDINMSKAKTKPEFRENFERAKTMVTDIVLINKLRVRNFEGDKIDKFIHYATHEIAGYSILSDIFEDDDITDFFVIKYNYIVVEYRDGHYEVYPRSFASEKHLALHVERFLRVNGLEINDGSKKIVHFELFGDRGCAISAKTAKKGLSLTMRKHSEEHIVLEQVVKAGVMTQEMADLMGAFIIGETNVIIGGLTGSGKTTTMRALLDEYLTRSNKRALVAEDTQELYLRHKHVVELLASHGKQGEDGVVTLYDLILTALRLKPKYIIVGEVRGIEAVAAVEGMETGHSTWMSMHGGNSWNIFNRLVTKYLMGMPSLSVPVIERIIGSSLDYVAIQDNIPDIGRRISMIDEVSYNFDENKIIIRPIIRFNLITQEFEWVNKISREKAMNMLRRGVKWDEIKQWVEEESVVAA
ncbi:hypothetical protein ABD91_25805 [Lysinibacillus sphaericus]|uniref:ATPase, T2SS/T4P/T4SS family n=1 Tax=Lysinibacillus sphaericus TaxID=1421 RepID=UPI001F50759F|nr:ATPase, T2SS/T4P/T4SS family [Lysinibacillus sphaericus]MBG9694153.1 hypothetical protein [Lysinibacillus sphaericus]